MRLMVERTPKILLLIVSLHHFFIGPFIQFMYKQTHIIFFIIASVAIHAIFLAQYSFTTPPSAFKKNDRFINIELSRQIPVQHAPATKSRKKAVSKNSDFKKRNQHSAPSNQTVSEQTPTNKQHIAEDNTETKNIKQPEQQAAQLNAVANLYLQQIIETIENNKFYPESARRRNMQDVIKVTFILLESGEITDLKIDGQHKLLKIAARTAILDSLPFSSPPGETEFPLDIKYSMAFKLN